MPAQTEPIKIMAINTLMGANSTENNVMNAVCEVDGVLFNQDELVSSLVAVKKYGAYITGGKSIEGVPTVEYNGETYVFGVYTLSSSAATTYRKGTASEFAGFLSGDFGPATGNGKYAFINQKNISD